VGVVQVAIAASTWGTWSLFFRPSGLSPWAATPIVFAVMGLSALPLYGRDRVVPIWTQATFGLLAINTLLDAINFMTFFGALQRTTVAVAVLTHYLAPVLIALLAPLIDRERVRGAVLAAIVAVCGLALVLEPWSPDRRAGDVLAGGLLGTTSAVAYALNVFVIRRLAARIGAARALGYHAFLAVGLVLPAALLAGEGSALFHASATAVLWIAAGAVIAGTLAGWIFVRGLAVIGPARAGVLAFLEPLVAVLVGWAAFGERVAPVAAIGGALILGAGIVVARAHDDGEPAPERSEPVRGGPELRQLDLERRHR